MLRKIWILLAGAVASSTACPAKADQWWVVVEKDAEGKSHLADSESIRSNGDDQKSFWSHVFFEIAEGQIQSSKLEYVASCSARTLQPRAYVDYDKSFKIIEKGNLDQAPAAVSDGTTGQRLFDFACLSNSQRNANFEFIYTIDYRRTGASLSKGTGFSFASPVASTIEKTTPVDKMPVVVAELKKYQNCVISSARNFSKSKETAPVIARSSIANCAAQRHKLAGAVSKLDGSSPAMVRNIMKRFDTKMNATAELEIVKLRSN